MDALNSFIMALIAVISFGPSESSKILNTFGPLSASNSASNNVLSLVRRRSYASVFVKALRIFNSKLTNSSDKLSTAYVYSIVAVPFWWLLCDDKMDNLTSEAPTILDLYFNV